MQCKDLTGIIEKFRDHELVRKGFNYMKNQTIDYQPDRLLLEKNRKKATIGTVATGTAYLIIGPGLISAAIAAYSAAKGYQALRDWAGK